MRTGRITAQHDAKQEGGRRLSPKGLLREVVIPPKPKTRAEKLKSKDNKGS
jgi:hypothetical protein